MKHNRLPFLRMKAPALLLSTLIAVSAVFVATQAAHAKEDEKEPAIEKLTLVKDTGEKFQEVETFKPTDTFGVLVKLNAEPKSGTKVKAVWMIADAGGMKDQKIFEKEIEFSAEALKDAK